MQLLNSRLDITATETAKSRTSYSSSRCTVRASEPRGAYQQSDSPPSSDIKERMPYNYTSTDGKRKATLEDAFVQCRDSSAAGQLERNSVMAGSQPWSLGWQTSERNLLWSDELASKLLKRVAAEELECSDEDLEARFAELTAVLPGLATKARQMKPGVLAALARDPAHVAERLIRLKALFPTADVEAMALRDFALLLGGGNVEAAAAELRHILPDGVDLDRLCEQHPSMLHVESFRAALEEVRRLMPRLDVATALTNQPEIIFSAQRHKSMIPYDPVPGSPH